MPTNIATEPQMVSAEEQMENARRIREHFERRGAGVDSHDLFDEKVRIYIASREDYPIPEMVGVGLGVLKENAAKLGNVGFTYSIDIHSIYTCGPVVVLARTDIRHEKGKPDKPVPAVGVFAFKNGKVIEWSDYYR
jgi:limonene-1,2-epoxide hydrolase